MIDNEFGMNITKVSDLNNQLSTYITSESKIEIELKKIEDLGKEAYSSENALKLNNNNSSIIEATHVKAKNLTSYKNYIEKYIGKYKEIQAKVENLSKEIIRED